MIKRANHQSQRITLEKHHSIAHYDHAGVGVVEDKFREVMARIQLSESPHRSEPPDSLIRVPRCLSYLLPDCNILSQSSVALGSYVITYLVSKKWSYDQFQKVTGHLDIGSLAHYDSARIEIAEPDFRSALNGL